MSVSHINTMYDAKLTRLDIAPVMLFHLSEQRIKVRGLTHKGIIALPACPKLAIHPIEPACSSPGNTSMTHIMTMGYIGPRTKPTRAKHTELAGMEWVNQTTSSRAIAIMELERDVY